MCPYFFCLAKLLIFFSSNNVDVCRKGIGAFYFFIITVINNIERCVNKKKSNQGEKLVLEEMLEKTHTTQKAHIHARKRRQKLV